MEKKINVIYLISNSLSQLYKIENSKKLQECLNDEDEIYQQYSEFIIDSIIDKSFNTNKYLKSELLISNNAKIDINYEIFNIYIDEILSKREITEIDSLNILDEKLYDLLTVYNNNDIIIIVDYKFIKHIKSLLQKEKIHKKIYFNSDFNKPISYIIKEFCSIMY